MIPNSNSAKTAVTYLNGCIIIGLAVGVLGIAQCARFFDVSSDQSTEDCIAKISDPILTKTAAFPSDVILRAKNARIEHIFYGNEDQARILAKSFEDRGWSTKVGPATEIAWATIIAEDPISFKSRANESVKEMCATAESHNMLYRSWRLSAQEFSDYVSQ